MRNWKNYLGFNNKYNIYLTLLELSHFQLQFLITCMYRNVKRNVKSNSGRNNYRLYWIIVSLKHYNTFFINI